MRPRCPYCDELAPHGDARLPWFTHHLDSRLHRWWWRFRKYWNI